MKPLANLIGALSFDDTTTRGGGLLRKIYFALAYNTTLPVNAMVALGGVTPYLILALLSGALTAAEYFLIVSLTVVSAFSYSLIYVVNDYIDRHKDARLAIPKQSARHVFGSNYLYYVGAGNIVVTLLAGLAVPGIVLPLVVYNVGLMILSWVHSNAGRGKALTIFGERFLKFCASLGLVHAASSGPLVNAATLGALLVYPFGFTLDYAYKGYLRERLRIAAAWRFVLYGVYWLVLASVVSASHVHVSAPLVAKYAVIYFALIALTSGLARVIRFKFLDKLYNDHVAGEKRRYLVYGVLQLVIVALGGLYVIAS